jgi:outer membrane protein TolC
MRRLAILTILLAFLVPCALAEGEVGPSALRLTLAGAIERARDVSASLRALDADVRAAQANVRVAQADRRPGVEVMGAYSRLSDVPELALTLPDGSRRVIFPSVQNWWSGELAARYPLYAGGRLSALESAVREEAEAAYDDRSVGEIDLDLEVTGAYWSLVTAREAERVLAEALSAYEAHLVDAHNREKFGLAARNEVLAVQVERDRAELNRIRAGNSADLAVADLVRLLDLPPGQRIEPIDTLDSTTAPRLDVEQLVRQALDARPERSALESRIAAASSRVNVERAARLPHVNLSGGWVYANPNTRVLPLSESWNDSWFVGIDVAFQVFDGGRARAAEARADARADGLQQRLEDLDRRIRLDVTSRVLEVRNAVAAVPVTERGVDAARENLRVARERYREGVIPSSELLDAEIALQRAGLDRAETLAHLRLALAGLRRAVGGLG